MPRNKPAGDKHAVPSGEFADYPLEAKTERRGAGRPVGRARFQMSHEHRIKIQNSKVLSELISHFETGKPAKTDGQIRIGLGLLKKVLPDLQSVTVGGDPLAPIVHEHKLDLSAYSVDELKTMRSIMGKGKGPA